MARKPKKDEESRMREVVEVLQFYYDNGKNARLTGRHFGKDPKTVSSWNNKYNLKELALEYNIVREVGTQKTTVERVLPPDVKEEAEKSFKNMTNISYKSTLMLDLWCDDMMERVLNSKEGIKALKPYEIERLHRLSKDYANYVLPNKTEENKDTKSAYESLKEKLQEKRIKNGGSH